VESFTITTRQRNDYIDITAQVRDALRRRGMRDGIGVIYCPHTTAGITINEAYDPDVVHDALLWLSRIVPHVQEGFRHDEGNSDAHIKASLVGSSATVIVAAGEVVLGRWQGIFLCEFDGPRTRTVQLKWISG
jgi:secondary thiamine-phosphate synthase enzyme